MKILINREDLKSKVGDSYLESIDLFQQYNENYKKAQNPSLKWIKNQNKRKLQN